MSKNTLNGSRSKVIKKSGFLTKIKTSCGIKILKNRKLKGRWRLTIR